MVGRWRRFGERLRTRRAADPADGLQGLDDPAVNALFDVAHYAAAAGVRPDRRTALAHYLVIGWTRGLDPHPLFSTRHYLTQARDVVAAGVNPLVHYARYGASELRSPHPLFDPGHYAHEGNRGWDAARDPLRHYLDHEGRDGREPNAWFDSDFYRRHSPDVAAAGVNPLIHYATFGWRERRRPHPGFDVAYYLRSNPDVTELGLEPLAHFLRAGIRQGRTPSADADVPMPEVAAPELVPCVQPPRSREHPVSVVVATLGDSPSLRAVLHALADQTSPPDEVIVVAESGGELLTRWADASCRRLVVHPGAGTAGRRNLGMFMSRAEIVLFLADDEVPAPTLVAEHRRAHAAFPQREAVIVGRTSWSAPDDTSPLAAWTMRADALPLGYPGNPRTAAPDLLHLRARQLSVKREFLALHGAFDPAFERFHDVELAIRLQLHGLDLRSWPTARSSRLDPGDVDALCADLVAEGPELVRLAAADPTGLVRDVCAVDGAPVIWRHAAASFEEDLATVRAAEGAVVAGRGDERELHRRYHRVLWASRARGITGAPARPAHAPPVRLSIATAVTPSAAPAQRRRVLVAGVVLADQPNTAAATAAELAASRHYDVDQRWIVVGRRRRGGSRPLSPRMIAERRERLTPKYELLGGLLTRSVPAGYDHVLLVDDDVDLPAGFLDAFLDIQRELGFVLAQPARAAGSPADHPIVLQQPGSMARRTWFVEQGPVLSIHRDALDAVLPFDLRSPMGWGYECVWSHRLAEAAAIGIVDATPVAHRLRPVAGLYAKEDGEAASARMLAAVTHRGIAQCMRVVDVHPLIAGWGPASRAAPSR